MKITTCLLVLLYQSRDNRGRTKGSTHWDRCGLEHQQLRPHRAQQVQLLCLYHLQDLFHHEHCQDQQDLSELMS